MTPKTGRERIAEMDQITLRMGNVVKLAASEEAARALEAKGFVRDGAPGRRSGTDMDTGTAEATDLKKELAGASKALSLANKKREAAEKELEEARKKLKEAEKKNEALLQELAGTREQLDAAVKKNTAASGKEK